ncbi:MAG TPA: hypothetical protein ENI34_03125 [candidate division WOR-3 bacterium]|uniref:Periplasmic chaperone PpiD n=1 Tax=candidate division WOR-3 bacterium TaxID=2052148 RepID=A0A9C9JZS1_UNCW3|nr:hypothetical protein [candidate division WOR-3 bacterium]
MMQTLRKKTRIILFIVLAGFAALIFFQWGFNIMGIKEQKETNIAEINGTPISYREYLRFYESKKQEQRGTSSEDIWNLMIEEFMWQDLVRKERVGVNDKELWEVIKSNPPQAIYESEYMQDENGKFDFNKYYELLRSPQSRSWLLSYESDLRRQIPKEKIRSLLSTFGWVSPYEDSIEVLKQTTKYNIASLSIPIYRARGLLNLSEEDLRTYYKKNREKFKEPERRVLKYVFFQKRPSHYDSLDARERLEDFLLRIEEGEDFLTVAREVSDDTSIVISFEGEAGLKPYLMRVYKKLKDGEVSDIIQASRAFEVIKRVRKGLVYKVRANIEVSATTRGEINDKIISFKEAAQEIGFDSAAAEIELPVSSTHAIAVENLTFPVRDKERLRKFLSKVKKGEVGGPFSSIGGYYLFTLDSMIPEHYPAFEKIKGKVEATMERELLKETVKDRLERAYEELVSGTAMEEVAARDTLLYFSYSRDINLGQIQVRYGGEVAGLVFGLEQGQISRPLMLDWAGYIVRCDKKEVSPFDSTMLTYLQMKRQVRLEQIWMKVFTPQEIKDNRDQFFE